MVTFQLAACSLLMTGIILQTSALDTYIAAVYEHAVILSGATPALGAHIIVTPEEGISGWQTFCIDIPIPPCIWDFLSIVI
uniref:Uncharacterized protein n=1 Tax=Anolis carolinensis TaxID=28377 RepID=A0A803TAF8_ANOCA